ncbi:Tachylectin [Micromonospora echinospora]|uniref:Tachylectin n=1 Tax=Micromonospora echinospora TaxID=1877 RepID=A0A1C4ZNS8_MICEC|nr:tachylectin-related carbohydrate-binding protein [Micromonospora echinospora]SCF34441.1 Tachylectin [Micromonospora echinospora]
MIAGSVVAPIQPTPAQAADTFTCTGAASVFNSQSTGILQRRSLNNPGTTSYSWGSATTIGSSGWNGYGRFLGGPDGRVYGINANGLTRFRWTGSAWETVDGKINWLISPSFTEHATSSMRNKITVDEIGDFYLIDASGKLRWYRYDETAKNWVISGRVLDTGWDKYDLVVAGTTGVLYARTPEGKLHRYRFDPVSQRWLSRDKLVGTGWNGFTKGLFSVGGDTLYGIQADGDLFQYRYREDTNTWLVMAHHIGSGWGGYPNVFATTNTCKLTETFSPPRPATPIQSHAPIAVMQAPAAAGAAMGTLEFVYSDNIGQLRHGRMDPDNFLSLQWTSVSEFEAYTGKPALTVDNQRVSIFAHQSTSNVRSRTQAATGSPAWNSWLGLGGAMKSEPAAVRLSDNTVAVFALDADGALWFRHQDGVGGDLLPWRNLGGSGLTGTPVVTPVADRAAIIVVADSAGNVRTTTYQDGALTAGWTDLGGGGVTGTPSVVLLPGTRLMVFGRHSGGTIQTKTQNIDGTWPGTWTPIGAGAITPEGSPSAVLSPNSGLVSVFTRAADGLIHHSRETAQGSGEWANWIVARPAEEPPTETYPVDPTAFTHQSSNGTVVAYVTRNVNGATRYYRLQNELGGLSAARSTSGANPTFEERTLPQPRP